MGRFRNSLARFMYGRYGTDTLYHATFFSALVIMIVNAFVTHPTVGLILYLAEFALIFWALFRFFSRNIYKRRRENQAFCGFFGRIGRSFKLRKSKFESRKTHVFRKCPTCRSQLRLPRQKGRHVVKCPCCKTKFDVKI